MSKVEQAYEKAMMEVKVLAKKIQVEMQEQGTMDYPFASALETAKQQYLYGSIYTLRNKRRKPAETKLPN